MTEEGMGFVVFGTSKVEIGMYASVWDMKVFQEFHGEVILSN